MSRVNIAKSRVAKIATSHITTKLEQIPEKNLSWGFDTPKKTVTDAQYSKNQVLTNFAKNKSEIRPHIWLSNVEIGLSEK